MTIKTLLNSNGLTAAAIIIAALFASGGLIANASSPFDIEFPIAELGNCADKTECKTYCDDSAHEDQCRAFAEKHGLGSARDDREEDKFDKALKDGGPGGCASGASNQHRACETYCNQTGNMRECVAYAKKHNLMDARELSEAEKVLRALDSGVPLPAACSDAFSCKEVCENPKDVSTMRQCFAFAASAGLLPDDVNPEQAEAMFRAIEEGRAPFRSPKDFEQCENPQSDEVFEKCIAFALESGILPPEEAEMIRKTGGKGPGGCRGERECNAYCEANHDECFAFAIEHDLLSAEDKRRMEEGKQEAQRALRSAPPEVLSCIESAIGHDELEQVKNGEVFFTPRLGEILPRCFDQVLGGQEHTGPFNRGVPPEAVNCMRQIFGDDFEARLRAGEIDPGKHDDEIRTCMERELGEGYLNDRGEYERPSPGKEFPEPRPEGEYRKEYREGEYPRPPETYPADTFRDYPPPPDGTRPPPVLLSPEEYERYKSEYPEQYREEYQQPYEQQYREQYEEYREQYGTPPPPEDGAYREFNPEMYPPQPESTEPSGLRKTTSQIASSIAALFSLLFGR